MLTIIFSSYSEFALVVIFVLISVQQNHWHRKRLLISQNATPENPETVESSYRPLSFLNFSPATKDFRCIWPYTTKTKRKCRNPINQETDRLWANTLRNTIADDSPYSERVEHMLREYAEFCICRLHRPEIHARPDIITFWVQQWLVEIRALHDSLHEELDGENSARGEGILLYPLTSIPDRTSDDGTPDVEERTGTNTPVKRETMDQVTPKRKVPGSFPGDDTCSDTDCEAMAIKGRLDARRSSTPVTPSPRRYSQAIRDSPSGVGRIKFRRISSATPRLGSTHTAEFEPYPNKSRRSLLDVLNTPLGKKEREPGYVYIFTRRSAEDTHSLYVKIGFTKHVGDRFEGWKTKCHYKPHLEYHTTRIPNAMRVELLIHTELIASRYIEQQCSGCDGKHDEWFKTDLDSARPVVERWAQWMQQCSPYTQDGQLSGHVVKEIFEHKLSKAPLTSRTMLALISSNVAAEPEPQSRPESAERSRTAPAIEPLDPLSPGSQSSKFPGSAADPSTAADDVESHSDSGQSCSPSPTPSGSNTRLLTVKKTRNRAASVKEDMDQAAASASRIDWRRRRQGEAGTRGRLQRQGHV